MSGDRRFVVMGYERGATGFAAALFSRCGVPCAHETISFEVDGGVDNWPSGFPGCSSWMAGAFVDDLKARSIPILWQRRAAESVLASWARHGSFTDEAIDCPFYAELYRRFPSLLDERSGAARWLAMFDLWEEIGVANSVASYSVEALSPGLVVDLLDLVGFRVSISTAREALSSLSSRFHSVASPPVSDRYAFELAAAIEKARARR